MEIINASDIQIDDEWMQEDIWDDIYRELTATNPII